MKYILHILVCMCLTGCIPLQQCEVTGGKKDDFFRYYGDYGLLNIGSANKKKAITLLPASSYAISPTGIKYGIFTEPHYYDLEQKFSYTRDHITLVTPRGKRIGKMPQNGIWHFHFEFLNSYGKIDRDFICKFWTFYYSPIIHGPPI